MRQRERSSQQETSKTINKEGKIKVQRFSAGLNKINNLQKKQKKKQAQPRMSGLKIQMTNH